MAVDKSSSADGLRRQARQLSVQKCAACCHAAEKDVEKTATERILKVRSFFLLKAVINVKSKL